MEDYRLLHVEPGWRRIVVEISYSDGVHVERALDVPKEYDDIADFIWAVGNTYAVREGK